MRELNLNIKVGKDISDIRTRVRNRREKLKIKSSKLSKKLDGSATIISMFETGRGLLGLVRFLKTLKLLGLEFYIVDSENTSCKDAKFLRAQHNLSLLDDKLTKSDLMKKIDWIRTRITELETQREDVLSKINDLNMPSNNFEEISLKYEEDKHKVLTARIEELSEVLKG